MLTGGRTYHRPSRAHRYLSGWGPTIDTTGVRDTTCTNLLFPRGRRPAVPSARFVRRTYAAYVLRHRVRNAAGENDMNILGHSWRAADRVRAVRAPGMAVA